MDLLVVGWDGATHRHLQKYDIPYWENLTHGGLLLPEPLFHGTYIDSGNAWTTISTGTGFENHRILSFLHGPYTGHPLAGPIKRLAHQSWVPKLGRRALISYVLGTLATDGGKGKNPQASDVQFQRMWEYLPTDALVFGLPITYPTWATNGVVVAGIPAPKPENASSPLVSPPELEEDVFADFDGYYIDTESPVNDDSVSEADYCHAHVKKTDAIVDHYLNLYASGGGADRFGFGFLMFRAIDDILHATENPELVGQAYEAVAKATGRIVDAIDPDAVLVLSDHGMAPTSRPDVDLRMDHDTTQGVWGSTEPFGLERHVDVTPAILDYFGVDADVPERKANYKIYDERVDESAVKDRLSDLGYL